MANVEKVWFVPPNSTDLESRYQLSQNSQVVKPAQQLTVSLVSAMVTKDLDGFLRGKNDLMIVTKSALGERPKVDRIHYFESEIPARRVLKDFYSDTVFISDDYTGERLWMEMNIVEVDTNAGDRKDAIGAFTALATTAGAVFPAIIPYAMVSSSVLRVTERLVAALEKDLDVVKVPIALYSGTPSPGRGLLQVGTYVAFATEIDGSRYCLTNGGEVQRKDGSQVDVSYVCFQVDTDKAVSPEFVITQRVATLLTQMQAKQTGSSARSAFEFIKETLQVYSSYRKLERYLRLLNKKEKTQEECALVERLKKELEQDDLLKGFLSKP